MNQKTKLIVNCLTLAVLGASVTASIPAFGQEAVATISDTAVSGGFDYTIVLQNTGSAALNSFWYGWTTSGNNLPSDPTTAANNLGWADNLSGNSIEWVNSTGTALAAGDSGTFTFFSTTTPTAITLSPSGESVAYEHGIDFSQDTPGSSTPVFSPTLVPEPSSVALVGGGLLGLAAVRRKFKA